MKAVKQLGVFWTAINEPPPGASGEDGAVQNGRPVLLGKEEVINEMPAPHPAFGG
jgi:hypothetical protein